MELANREAQVLELGEEVIENAELGPGIVAAHWAWLHLTKSRPWLDVFTAVATVGRRNSDVIVRGGALSHRMAQKMVNEVSLPLE